MSAPTDRPPDSDAPPASGGKDFKRLRESHEREGASLAIGARICSARDRVARVLIALGLTPNAVTVLGFLVTCGAAYCLYRGAGHQLPFFYNGIGPQSWWPLGATLFLFASGACDMLDGAVARVGNMSSRFGAVLDSTLDRMSDMVIFVACLFYFVRFENVTLQVLAVAALCSSILISYVKARAEEIIDDCSVGYWLRGERFAAVLIGCATGHVAFVLWQLGLTNWLTVWRRISYSYGVIAAQDAGRPLPPSGPNPGWTGRFQLWRRPRGSIGYDIVTGLNIAMIVVASWIWPVLGGAGDPLRAWLGG